MREGGKLQLCSQVFTEHHQPQRAPRQPTYTLAASHIFSAPLGPKPGRSTSCSPRAAQTFTAKASWLRVTSAPGLASLIAAMVQRSIPQPADSEPWRHAHTPELRPIGPITGSDAITPRRDGSQNRLTP